MHKEHFCTTETPQKIKGNITEIPRKITENHGKSRKITENHGKSRKGFFRPITEIVESLVGGICTYGVSCPLGSPTCRAEQSNSWFASVIGP